MSYDPTKACAGSGQRVVRQRTEWRDAFGKLHAEVGFPRCPVCGRGCKPNPVSDTTRGHYPLGTA